MTLTTPALLFPAISLLLLAYTNRFLVLAQLRAMQAFGILSFIACTISMFSLFLDQIPTGQWVFGCSLILLVISLSLSFWEIQISCVAINIELEDLRSGATGSDKALTEA